MSASDDLCDIFTDARNQGKPTPNAEILASILRNRFLAEKTYVCDFLPQSPLQLG